VPVRAKMANDCDVLNTRARVHRRARFLFVRTTSEILNHPVVVFDDLVYSRKDGGIMLLPPMEMT